MSERQKPYYVLGLDPGIASCGFCLIDLNNHEILEMGSHLFKAPQEDKTKTSLAVTRRNKRSIRRNTARTKARLKHCLELLQEAGLVPIEAGKDWFQPSKGEKPVLKLRARGLDTLLTDREFAQILYSLCGHRGYIPHGEGAGQTDDAEGKQVLSAIAENTKQMQEGNWRTVGEMLNAQGRSRNKGGNYDFCVYNSQIQDEVRTLFNNQRAHGNTKATVELENAYIDCLTWEKKSLDRDWKTYKLVGHCSYFPAEYRAANADLSSELCRAYERFGHLVIVHADGSEETLDKTLIEKYLDTLFSPVALSGNKDCKVKYSDIRKDLDISGKDIFKGVDPDDEKKKEVFEPKSWRCLRKSGVSSKLLAQMLEDIDLADAIGEALTFASSEPSLRERLSELDLDEGQVEELIEKVPFNGKLFKGYGSRSLKALVMLLSAFEDNQILTLADAEKATGLLGLRLTDRIPRSTTLPPYELYDDTCRNPVVLRAMSRMRKIVNAITKRYGVPNEIHIELGRDLKHSQREKDRIAKNQKENQARNKRLAAIAAEHYGCAPEEIPGRLIRKMALREEQGEKDIYTGYPIKLEDLLQDDRKYEIDHILPFSRTSIDSQSNKVLVAANSNQNKKERTPYEWMTSGEASAPNWDEFKARVMACVKNPNKRKNFLNEELDSEAEAEFIERNKNDMRYMSRAVMNYLAESLLFPEDGHSRHVYALTGSATSLLRHSWGLNFGTNNEKDRSDDRHHAVDAAVIAACNTETIKKIATARANPKKKNKEGSKAESRMPLTQPWPTFALEVEARRERIIPTRMVNHGVTGRAYEETIYRVLSQPDEKGYAILEASEKAAKKGNVWFKEDGSAQLVDGVAFLRLWLDPNAKKGKGKWYAEPVYYADIPKINNGSYIPRACQIHVARTSWESIPKAALQSKPVVLRFGSMLQIDNHLARYKSFGIGNCRLMMANCLNGSDPGASFPSTPGGWNKNTLVRVINEDVLGHCFSNVAIQDIEYKFKTPE